MSKESATQMLSTAITGAKTEPVAPVETPKTDVPLDSTRFAQLAKKEQELQKQREALRAEQDGFKSEREKFTEIRQKLEQFEEMKVKDPVAALKLAGFSEKDLYKFIAAQEDNSTPEEKAIKATQSEIAKFKEEQEKIRLEAETKRNEEVIKSFKEDITKTIKDNADKFEFCSYNGPAAEELIYDTVAQVLQDSGEVITPNEAAEMVEAYYEEQYKLMSNLKKIKPKEEPKPESKPETSQPSKTLSSKVAATAASTVVTKRESPSEKKARLINKLANLGKE